MRKKLIALLLGLIISLCTQVNVNAMDSIELIYPNTQKEGAINYFHLLYEQNREDSFGFKIYNDSEEEQTYLVSINKGITNKNGIITFEDSTNGDRPNESESFISIPSEITVGAKETKEVHGAINYPSHEFTGSQLSGLAIKPKEQKGTSSVEFVYPIITQGRLIDKKNPIKFKGSTVKEADGSYELIIPFDNNENKWSKEAEYTLTITNNGESVTKKESLEFAPNFKGELVIPFELKSGKSIIDVEVKTPWGTYHEELEKQLGDKLNHVFLLISLVIWSIPFIVIIIRQRKRKK